MEENTMVYTDETVETEEVRTESPVVNVFKKAGLVAIFVLAGYGAVSAVKDAITLAKDVKAAGGMKEYKAQQQFEKQKKKEEKEENEN